MVCKIGLKVAKNENAAKFSRYQILISVIAYAVPFTPTYRITRMNMHLHTQRTYNTYNKKRIETNEMISFNEKHGLYYE
jgi:hypothetical protein